MNTQELDQIRNALHQGTTLKQATEIWESIDFDAAESWVLDHQKRLFQAHKNGENARARKLGQLITNGDNTALVALKKVTEYSKGHNTPGVDKFVALRAIDKLELLLKLNLDARARPCLQCEIPKANGKGFRTLGIPTIRDRILQEVCRLAIDPLVEVLFVLGKLDAYGYRIGKSREDAIHATRNFIDKFPLKFVACCDIEAFFDKANHEVIIARLKELPISPEVIRYIKRTLKAGSLRKGKRVERSSGTPQGGPISGTLANLILFGLEDYIQSRFPKTCVVDGKRTNWTPAIIRYADDIRIIHPDKQVVRQCIEYLGEFLQTLGLKLNREKTEIRSSREGFDFLGYTVRQYARDPMQRRSRRPYATLVTPSKTVTKRHYRELAQICDWHNSKNQEDLICALNPKIRGWAYAYTRVNASKTFSKLDHWLHVKLMRWAKRRHNNKSKRYLVEKYFNGSRPWKFATTVTTDEKPETLELQLHSRVKAKRKSKSPKAYSIYDASYKWKRRDTSLALKYKSEHEDISAAWEELRKPQLHS